MDVDGVPVGSFLSGPFSPSAAKKETHRPRRLLPIGVQLSHLLCNTYTMYIIINKCVCVYIGTVKNTEPNALLLMLFCCRPYIRRKNIIIRERTIHRCDGAIEVGDNMGMRRNGDAAYIKSLLRQSESNLIGGRVHTKYICVRWPVADEEQHQGSREGKAHHINIFIQHALLYIKTSLLEAPYSGTMRWMQRKNSMY